MFKKRLTPAAPFKKKVDACGAIFYKRSAPAAPFSKKNRRLRRHFLKKLRRPPAAPFSKKNRRLRRHFLKKICALSKKIDAFGAIKKQKSVPGRHFQKKIAACGAI
jgi:hypothetical protein